MVSPQRSSATVKECDGETMLGLNQQGKSRDLLNLLGRFAGASILTGAYQGRAHQRDFFLGPPSPSSSPCATAPDPSCFDWPSGPCRALFTYVEVTSDVEAALIASQLLTGTVPGRDSFSSNGRDWGTKDFLGRDTAMTDNAMSQ